MATKTISVDLRAYERLRRARQSEHESFSQVIHRASWPNSRATCGDLRNMLREEKLYVSPKEIELMDEAQRGDEPPQSRWS
jgi:hypothetical protein